MYFEYVDADGQPLSIQRKAWNKRLYAHSYTVQGQNRLLKCRSITNQRKSFSFCFNIVLYTPLSGDDIWIKVLPQKRYAVHIDGCDIWNNLRPFLKYLAHPFSNKLRSKEAKGIKSGNLGKQNFFFNINFLLDSILMLLITVNFCLKVA